MTWLRLAWACDPWGVLGRAVLLVAALAGIVHNCGCALAVWPSPCPLEQRADGSYFFHCRGRLWREHSAPLAGKPRPAGVQTYTLDGVLIPLQIDADDLGTCPEPRPGR